jgi:Ca-activated chloride channel family protein
MEWANPEWFWALLLLPVVIGLYLYRFFRKKRAALSFSSLDDAKKLPGNWKSHLHWLTALFSWAGLSLLIIALARPQEKLTTIERNAEGIDIVMVIDISSSMRAEDLQPNRFEAAFAMKSFTVVPPTLDYKLLTQLLEDLEMGIIEDGTAIGMGIATAINRLKDGETKSKVIILLTDGQNNAGEIDPVTAADLAVTYGIKIYTIGAGTRGTAPYPIQDPIFGRRYQNIEVNIDEEMLTSVAQLTGGKYYRATDTEELINVYNEIDQLEKSEVEELIYTDYEDEYPLYLALSFLLLTLAFTTDRFVLRSVVEA